MKIVAVITDDDVNRSWWQNASPEELAKQAEIISDAVETGGYYVESVEIEVLP